MQENGYSSDLVTG